MFLEPIIQAFKKGTDAARPMLRWWFPDAGADLEQVRHQVDSFVQAGYGGVEVAMVPQHVDFDAEIYGWATERWRRIMKTILKEAPADFEVDFTITAHWPPALDTITPNSQEAMQQITYACCKVGPDWKGRLPMPEPLTMDRDGFHSSPFLFTDRFVAASVAQVAEVWNGKRITLRADSLQSVTDRAMQVLDPSTGEPLYTPAGIPEDATEFGSRPKMADRQYYYEIDLAGSPVSSEPSEGSEIQPGDWLLFAYYCRGTGQTLSGRDAIFTDLRLPRASKVYATDYYSESSTKALTDFWEENLLSDPELRQLMEARKGAIFEDSIETGSQTPLWTVDFLSQFEELNGYDLTPMLPLVASTKGSRIRFVTPERMERRVRDDYEQTMNQLYIRHHVEGLQRWTRTFGYCYRAQSYGGFIDTSRASTVLDIAEGETLGFNDVQRDADADRYRAIAGGVHMSGRKLVSQEALAMLGKSYAMTWKDALVILNRSMAAGANRAVMHGASFDRAFNNVASQWPGWHAFGSSFAESWTDRQPYWEQVGQFNNYVMRVQTVLQGGHPEADVAVLKKLWPAMDGRTDLLDAGYNYDIISGPHLFLPSAVVEDRILARGKGSYRALLVYDIKALEPEEMEKISGFARAGLPVVFCGRTPEQAYGWHPESDAEISGAVRALASLPNVAFADRDDQLPGILTQLGVKPSISGDCTGLRYQKRTEEDGSCWYFLVNWTDEAVRRDLSLDGAGKIYQLNAWNGRVWSTGASAGRTMSLELEPHEAVLLAATAQKLDAEARPLPHQDCAGESVPVAGWSLKLESWGPGGDEENHPEHSGKTTVVFGTEALGPWDTLPASRQELERLGVPGMEYVSGIGTYTAEVNLERAGRAYLEVDHGQDMVTRVLVNGEAADYVDHASGLVYLGSQLKQGTNSLEIRITAPLNNRLKLEDAEYRTNKMGGPPPTAEPEEEIPDDYDYEDFTESPPPGGMPGREMQYGLYGVRIHFC